MKIGGGPSSDAPIPPGALTTFEQYNVIDKVVKATGHEAKYYPRSHGVLRKCEACRRHPEALRKIDLPTDTGSRRQLVKEG
jgi:hypothetical protein